MGTMITKVAIIGAGAMGSGIAQKMALEGIAVELIDVDQKVLEMALERIKTNIGILTEGQYLNQEEANSIIPKIKVSDDITTASNAHLVLEAVTENLGLKQNIFRELDAICPKETILATNTSTLRISHIASVTKRTDKVIGIHWVNPPYLIPLVEVIRADETSQETLDSCVNFLKRIKIVPGVCQKDIPGFIINRIQKVIQNEALSLVERGIVTMEDVDNIIWLALGARLALYGPLKINDLIGNKSQSLHGFEYMYQETGDPRFKPSELLKSKVDKGELGIRTGKGWFDYGGKSFTELSEERDQAFIKIINFLKKEGFYPKEIS